MECERSKQVLLDNKWESKIRSVRISAKRVTYHRESQPNSAMRATAKSAGVRPADKGGLE
jgi:hypothetical protein